MSSLHIALAPLPSLDLPEKNLRLILAALERAAGLGADILCLPETALSGISHGRIPVEFHKAIGAKAREVGVACIYGAYDYDAKRKLYNSAFLVDDNGKNLLVYHKKHLWQKEEVTPGRKARTVQLKNGITVGIMICWDIAFPEVARSLARQGAQVIFCPSYWFGRENGTTRTLPTLAQARAFENQCFVVVCDAGDRKTTGRCGIYSPLGPVAEGVQKDLAGVAVDATVDLDELPQLRSRFNCWPGGNTR